jgi:membrane-associated phospholipid phosphatase
VAQTLLALHFQRRLAPLLAVLTLLLAVGAVYGGFHYAIDASCGLLLGTGAVLLAPHAYRWLGGRWRAAPEMGGA